MGSPYSALREEGYPTYYPPLKTAVTVDVLEIGLIVAFLTVIVSFAVIIPGIRGWQRLFATTRFVIGSYLLVSIMLSLYGMEWEVAEIHDTPTYYKAFETGEIHADIGVKIGLNAVNITLKSDGDGLEANETIDYNERFHFYGDQGRIGFGRFSGRINREFREAQWLGKPYPILWIAEYFTLDGEDIRWGRSYRLAGYYTWIMLWTAFPMYFISMILFFNVVRYGAYFLMGTGACMITANILFASIRYGSELVIPFTDEKKLFFHKGHTFFVCLVAGLIALICGFIVLVLDYFEPEKISTFFNVDPLIDYEETFVYEGENEKGEIQAVDLSAGGDQPVRNVPLFTKNKISIKMNRERRLTLTEVCTLDIESHREPSSTSDMHSLYGNGLSCTKIRNGELELSLKDTCTSKPEVTIVDIGE